MNQAKIQYAIDGLLGDPTSIFLYPLLIYDFMQLLSVIFVLCLLTYYNKVISNNENGTISENGGHNPHQSWVVIMRAYNGSSRNTGGFKWQHR